METPSETGIYTAIRAKFTQNNTLKGVLVNSGEQLLAESSSDTTWGTGLHLHNKSALNKAQWKVPSGGAMSEILSKV